MAKRKRAPHEKPFSRPMQKSVSEATVADAADSLRPPSDSITSSDAADDAADVAADDTTNEITALSETAHSQALGETQGDVATAEGAPTEGIPTEGIPVDVATAEVAINNLAANSNASDRGAATDSGSPQSSGAGVADPFIGQWNRLISTTNWEKGEIICNWRTALQTADEAVTEYSDEAWAQLVGGVTSQHVGRLRRVSQRFGGAYQQYEGLHWSHFQACLDWEDAEMWLEGSIQNGWSVSQMRGKRWETVGTTPEEQRAEVTQAATEQKTEAQAEAALAEPDATSERDSLSPSKTEVDALAENTGASADESAIPLPSPGVDSASAAESADQVSKRTRLSVDVESLPGDLAEAFESFKLAIIAHRRENWRDTTPESVVECLDSLKQLALADAE